MSGPTPSPRLAALLAERGFRPGDYGLCYWTGEGRVMPNGEEEASGYILTRRGCFFGWIGWDANHNRPYWESWWRVRYPRDWRTDPEFQQARAQLRPQAASGGATAEAGMEDK